MLDCFADARNDDEQASPVIARSNATKRSRVFLFRWIASLALAMTALVIACDKREAFAQGSETTKQSSRRHSGMVRRTRPLNPYPRSGVWIPGSLASLAPRNDGVALDCFAHARNDGVSRHREERKRRSDPVSYRRWIASLTLAMTPFVIARSNATKRSSRRHSGMVRRTRPGIHIHDREYGFRVRSLHSRPGMTAFVIARSETTRRSSRRHSGMVRRTRPGIHIHDREYGFRVRSLHSRPGMTAFVIARSVSDEAIQNPCPARHWIAPLTLAMTMNKPPPSSRGA
jgi:hypothetical protein